MMIRRAPDPKLTPWSSSKWTPPVSEPFPVSISGAWDADAGLHMEMRAKPGAREESLWEVCGRARHWCRCSQKLSPAPADSSCPESNFQISRKTFIGGSQLTHWACFWAGIEAFILPSTPQIKRKLAFSSIHELAQEISDDLKSVLQFLR